MSNVIEQAKKLGLDLEGLKAELSNQLPLMEGREKAESQVMDTKFTIKEYGFMSGKDGEYVAYTVKEDDQHFYFGNSILSDCMKKIEKGTDIKTLLENDLLTVKFSKEVSKQTNRKYTKCEFFI